VLLFCGIMPVLLRLFPGAPAFHAPVLLFQLVAAVLAFSVKLVFECRFGEMTQTWIIACAIAVGAVATNLRWPPMVRFLTFASGVSYMTSGRISWSGIAVCLVLSGAAMWAAVRLIERREF
jgi:hypothetical protein